MTYILVVKKTVLISLRMCSLKSYGRFQFCGTNIMTGDNVLF